MNGISYLKMSQKLIHFKKWLIGNDIALGNDNRLDACIKCCESAHKELLVNKKIINEKNIFDVHSLSLDTFNFLNIYNAFGKNKLPEMFRSQFSQIVKGPKQIKLEVPGKSNGPRNFVFELSIISDFKVIGCKLIPSASDLLIKLRESNIRIECKRPQSFGSLENNILEAADQLQMRFCKNDIGWIFISLDKILNQTGGNYEYESLEKFENILSQKIKDIHNVELYETMNKVVKYPQILFVSYIPNIPFHSNNLPFDSIPLQSYFVFTFRHRSQLTKELNSVINKLEYLKKGTV